MKAPAYDRMGLNYSEVRRADPRFEAAIWQALPEIAEHDRQTFPSLDHLGAVLPDPQIETIPAPGDCSDGFCIALWSQPEAHLDPRVRQSSSIWHCLPEEVIDRGLGQLRRDLESGEWDRRYGHLRRQDSLDVGLRLVSAGQ